MATYPMNYTDRRHQKVDAQVRYDEAVETVSGIIDQLKTISRRAALIAARTGTIEVHVKDPLKSEGPLFALTNDDFVGIDLATIRELTNALVLARKEVTGAEALARALGCNI